MSEIICSKEFNFGKVDYNQSGRKNCPVDVTVELRNEHNSYMDIDYVELSICGNIWNPRKTDIYCGGQCLDTIKEFIGEDNETFNKIYEWWQKYHLNGLKAGTPEQEELVKEYHKKLQPGDSGDYKRDCDYLKYIGKYEVEFEGKTYAYGTAWLVDKIPDEVVEEIKNLCENT